MTEPSYNADDLTVLEGLESVRKRPGMYIGSTDSAGVQHLVWEIVDNSVDEALAGHANNIEVDLNADGSVEVRDNGRGIPTDINKKMNLSGVELALTKLHGGGKFGGSGYKSAGGLHGVGSSVVNALSSRLDATIYRDNKVHQVSFQRGNTGVFADATPDGKFKAQRGLQVSPDKRPAAEKKARKTGTTIKWWHDHTIFEKGSKLNLEGILERARTTAFLVPGLSLTINDLRDPATPRHETFHFTGGVKDMVEYLAPDEAVHEPVFIDTTGYFKEMVQVLGDNGHLTAQDVDRELEIKIAFRWGAKYEATTKSFVNVVNTPQHGTHVRGFKSGLLKTVQEAIKGRRGLLKSNEPLPILEDIEEGLTSVVSVGLPEPQFLGQTKEALGTNAVAKVVQKITVDTFTAWLNERKNAAISKTILEKIVNASRTRLAARAQKEVSRRKTALQGASMPTKLVDCGVSDPTHTELLIVEGDSALGSMRPARDSRYQALFPIKGKILNAQKSTTKQILDNVECAAIIQVVGAGSGRSFDVDSMRYQRIIIAADADVDGSHIRTLLITFFLKHMREAVEQGRLYAAVPPLFSVKTTGKNSETIYFIDEEDMAKTLAKLDKAGKKYGTPSRFKGLGEMDPSELWDTTLDPTRRVLRQITVDQLTTAENMVELAMGGDVASRKEWIIAQRALISEEDIDA